MSYVYHPAKGSSLHRWASPCSWSSEMQTRGRRQKTHKPTRTTHARTVNIDAHRKVPPGGRAEVKLWLTCEKIGSFRLPVTVEIKGSVEPPLQASGTDVTVSAVLAVAKLAAVTA